MLLEIGVVIESSCFVKGEVEDLFSANFNLDIKSEITISKAQIIYQRTTLDKASEASVLKLSSNFKGINPTTWT
jgi:hypothetical protein